MGNLWTANSGASPPDLRRRARTVASVGATPLAEYSRRGVHAPDLGTCAALGTCVANASAPVVQDAQGRTLASQRNTYTAVILPLWTTLWISRQLAATFTDTEGSRVWIRTNDAFLSDPSFWESEDHYLLWKRTATPSAGDFPRLWTRKSYTVKPKWSVSPPPQGRLRVVAGASRTATVCSLDLVPAGEVRLPFDPYSSALDAEAAPDGSLKIDYFGPN